MDSDQQPDGSAPVRRRSVFWWVVWLALFSVLALVAAVQNVVLFSGLLGLAAWSATAYITDKPVQTVIYTLVVFFVSLGTEHGRDLRKWWHAMKATRNAVIAGVVGWIALFLVNVWSSQPYVLYSEAKSATPKPAKPGPSERIVERVDPNPALSNQIVQLTLEQNRLKGQLENVTAENTRLSAEAQRLRGQLRDKRDVGAALRAMAAQKNLWDALLRRAEKICKLDQVGTFHTDYTTRSRETREALEASGYGEFVDDFQDLSDCRSGVPTACLSGGFNDEATKWYTTTTCRIRGLRAVIEKLRAIEAKAQ